MKVVINVIIIRPIILFFIYALRCECIIIIIIIIINYYYYHSIHDVKSSLSSSLSQLRSTN